MIEFIMPLTRLAKHRHDGVPLDKDFYKSYYFAFEFVQVRMIFDGDYHVQVRGQFVGDWYKKWTTIFTDFRQNEAIREFSYIVNQACYTVETAHGVWRLT